MLASLSWKVTKFRKLGDRTVYQASTTPLNQNTYRRIIISSFSINLFKFSWLFCTAKAENYISRFKYDYLKKKSYEDWHPMLAKIWLKSHYKIYSSIITQQNMKNIIKSIALFSLSLSLFNCSNTNEPIPSGASQTVQMNAAGNVSSEEAFSGNSGQGTMGQGSINSRYAWRLAKTLEVPHGKGFNLTAPFAITSETTGDIAWDEYGCYYALKPLKVSFNNLKIVDISSISQASVKNLPFNLVPIANAPQGSAFWTNYMPVKTVIACKTATGKYYLLEVAADNPLKVNIYHWALMI